MRKISGNEAGAEPGLSSIEILKSSRSNGKWIGKVAVESLHFKDVGARSNRKSVRPVSGLSIHGVPVLDDVRSHDGRQQNLGGGVWGYGDPQ